MATGRDLSMLNIAMFDAVNAAMGSPDKSFYSTGPVIANASAQAAADAAAYDFLSQRFSGQAAQITAAYQSQLASLPNNQATANGITLGQNQASIVAAARANDGSSAPPHYVVGSGPGVWQPTPPGNIPFGTANWATVTPFTMTSPSEFRPGPPPALGSMAYSTALAQVQSLGAANSTTRTADQTQAAEFWDSDGRGGVPLTWNKIALQVAESRTGNLLGNAQLFAVLSAAQVDSFIATYDSKVTYSFWRPVTAINATTDPNWKPLLAAPPFPSYAANHASVAETGAAILDSFFGSDAADFSVTMDTDNSSAASLGNPTFGVVTRDFTSFSEAAMESGMSRLWGGVHFSFDIEQGFDLGNAVAQNALDIYVVPEPMSIAVLGIGVAALGLARRRQERHSNVGGVEQ
jgi:hypothetical protein